VQETSRVAWDSVSALEVEIDRVGVAPPLIVEDEHIELAVAALLGALDRLD
jgi:hypothetical protein